MRSIASERRQCIVREEEESKEITEKDGQVFGFFKKL